MMNSLSRAAASANSAVMLGGAEAKIFVVTPRTSASVISNIVPGAQTAAHASSYVMLIRRSVADAEPFAKSRRSGAWPESTARRYVECVDAEHLRSDEFGEAVQDADGDYQLADRFEALEAEKVIQRALELEGKSSGSQSVISGDQLRKIAEEIGIDPLFVSQALGEIRLAPPERSRFSRWVIPEDMFETITIDGVSRQELDVAIDRWMTQREGLTASKASGNSTEWDVDRRWTAKARARTLSGDNRIVRVTGGDVTHAVHDVSQSEHVVALASQGRWPLLAAKLVMAVGGAFTAIFLLGSLLNGQVVMGLLVAAALAVATVTLGVSLARWWARSVRGALSRSLLGLAKQVGRGGSGLMSRLRETGRKVRRKKPKDNEGSQG